MATHKREYDAYHMTQANFDNFGGEGAQITPTVASGRVTGFTIDDGGKGYATSAVVSIEGGSGTGAAAGSITVATGAVSRIILDSGGEGYSSLAKVEIKGGGGAGATAVISTILNGKITAVSVTNGGTGYTSAPEVNIIDGAGSGARVRASVDELAGEIKSIAVSSAGSGYTSAPVVTVEYGYPSWLKELTKRGTEQTGAFFKTALNLVYLDVGEGYKDVKVGPQGDWVVRDSEGNITIVDNDTFTAHFSAV